MEALREGSLQTKRHFIHKKGLSVLPHPPIYKGLMFNVCYKFKTTGPISGFNGYILFSVRLVLW